MNRPLDLKPFTGHGHVANCKTEKHTHLPNIDYLAIKLVSFESSQHLAHFLCDELLSDPVMKAERCSCTSKKTCCPIWKAFCLVICLHIKVYFSYW